MFCKNCGCEVKDGEKFCASCGSDLSMTGQFTQAANEAFNKAEENMGSAIQEVHDTFQSGGTTGEEKLKTDRSLLTYILLTIITCGIYSFFFIYKLAQDVNTVCEGDGDTTPGLVPFIFLSLITCGIYAMIWYYKLGNRLANNAPRYGINFQENGTTVLLWMLFGSLLCGIGPFIAWHIIIKNTNELCAAYNSKVVA